MISPEDTRRVTARAKRSAARIWPAPSDQEMPSKTCWMISSWVSYFSWGWSEKAGLAAQREELQRPRSQPSMCARRTDGSGTLDMESGRSPNRLGSCLTVSLQSGLFRSLVKTDASMNSHRGGVFIPSQFAGNRS